MAFSFSNLLKSKKETIINQQIPRIDFKGGTKYATNESSDVYLDFEELGGFPYIKTIVIGDINEKVKRIGCSLTFYFEKDSLTIHSDNTDIGSNNIKNTPFFFTEIDFELDENEASKIKNQKVFRIEFVLKKYTFSFKTI